MRNFALLSIKILDLRTVKMVSSIDAPRVLDYLSKYTSVDFVSTIRHLTRVHARCLLDSFFKLKLSVMFFLRNPRFSAEKGVLFLS